MKRDMDLIRELLLALEDLDLDDDPFAMLAPPYKNLSLAGWETAAINMHLVWLLDAQLIVGEPYDPRNAVIFRHISWAGCDFLDTVRDPEVWKRTKDSASKMGGWTFGLLKDLGTAYLKHVAKERLGLDL